MPIAESEPFYIALKDVGVPCVMVRYPREGHGLRARATACPESSFQNETRHR